MGTKTAVIDTNVLISALAWHGKPLEVLKLAGKGEIQMILSRQQLQELARVLRYQKINFTEQQAEERIQLIKNIAHIVDVHIHLDAIPEDPDDNIILATAVENNAAYLITGDKHLLKLKQYENVKIMTPGDFLVLFD